MSETTLDYSHQTWISLLCLLKPIEFVVTVDHFPIWRRHLAWAIPSGSDLKAHIIQRFSSNMVFMSLLLGAELSVLFNSSDICTEMRKSMKNEQYGNLEYWIGVTIILSVCVTITALVATFTAWGMVSTISDVNIRCVIRSSIGQYVTQLPPDLVVMAMYLFLFWVVLFLVHMLNGFMMLIILLAVMTLFFQVVCVYSAFGRLILHTGAMGTNPVVSPELEQALLPSGLHAFLLIKATTRQQRRTTVVSVYRKDEVHEAAQRRSPSPFPSSLRKMDDSSSPSHRRLSSASSSSSIDMGETARKPPLPSPRITSLKETSKAGTGVTATVSPDHVTAEKSSHADHREVMSRAKLNRESADRRRSSRKTSFHVREEWEAEQAAREMYDVPPPPDLSDSDDEYIELAGMPSPSVLNTHSGWRSLRRLVIDTTDDSRAPSLIAGSESGSNLRPVLGGNQTLGGDNASQGLDEENLLDVGSGEKDRLLPRVGKVYSSLGGK